MKQQVILHSYGVAEYMYRNAESNKDEMYVLGLLHDIGKLNGFENHGAVGADLMSALGFKYSKEIELHGSVQGEYYSYELDLLNAADLSVDQFGNEIGYKARIFDIKERYGSDSLEYNNAKALSLQLIDKGFLQK